jgi:hypothetical protein
MTTLTLGSMLDRSARYEQGLESYYADLRDGCSDNGVRLLTYSLRRQHQQQLLSQLSDGQLEDLRNTILEPVPELEAPWLDQLPVWPGGSMCGDDVLQEAIALRGGLISYYRAAYVQLSPGSALELLQTLIQVEERDIMMLNKMRDMRYL